MEMTKPSLIAHKPSKDVYKRQVLPLDLVNAEDEYIAKETMLLVEMEIENMPEKQRTIYKMSRNQGIPNDKIAEQLEISKRTVENQLSLAMKQIRNVLSFFF